MTRGGAAKTRDEPERRCVATGESGPKQGLIRFVLGPDGLVVPDLAERLPGRGVWVTATRAAVEKAATKRLFSRGLKTQAAAPDGLVDLVEALLAKRLIETVALARKAGQAVAGFEKVRARLREGDAGAVLAARDGAADGRAKIAAMAGESPVIAVLDGGELGLAFGRDSVIHAALDSGGLTDRVKREARRLDGFRQSG